jgi:hypothetical protein
MLNDRYEDYKNDKVDMITEEESREQILRLFTTEK